jgi:UDP-N-acetylglucosamine transferase subunit ALG13
MQAGKNGKTRRKYRILVAPLDWGLGHATRCIPIIRALLDAGCEVSLAGEGSQESLLKSEFPEMAFHRLTGYRIQYSRKCRLFFWKIAAQIPSILQAIRKEHRWLRRLVRKQSFDAVISDNRFGLSHPRIPSIFITHQLGIQSPGGRFSEKILGRWNYRYINRFSECWVPDFAGGPGLAGKLSHPSTYPKIPVRYTGILSRFMGPEENSGEPGHLLFILSGPEPQRTAFENRVVNEVSHYPGTATIVRGLPGALSIIPSTGMIKFFNHLPAAELEKEIRRAEWVISRTGYSTVMDLVRMEKKMILVPTPGQTEQEYLAMHLAESYIACTMEQRLFSLDGALRLAQRFDYRFLQNDKPAVLDHAIASLLMKLDKMTDA